MNQYISFCCTTIFLTFSETYCGSNVWEIIWCNFCESCRCFAGSNSAVFKNSAAISEKSRKACNLVSSETLRNGTEFLFLVLFLTLQLKALIMGLGKSTIVIRGIKFKRAHHKNIRPGHWSPKFKSNFTHHLNCKPTEPRSVVTGQWQCCGAQPRWKHVGQWPPLCQTLCWWILHCHLALKLSKTCYNTKITNSKYSKNYIIL